MGSEHKPLIILCGKSRSGKDTVAARIISKMGGVTIAQADPLKRLVQDIFEFSTESLWGSSELRNIPDPRFSDLHSDRMEETIGYLNARFLKYSTPWVQEVLPDATPNQFLEACRQLGLWFDDLLVRIGRYEGLTPRLPLMSLGTEWGRRLEPNVWSHHAIRKGFEWLSDSETPAIITDGRYSNEWNNVRNAGGIAIRIRRPQTDSLMIPGAIVRHSSELDLDITPDEAFHGVIVNDGTLEDLYLRTDLVLSQFFATV